MQMESKKVTRAQLRELEVGESLIIPGMTYAAVDSGRTSAYTCAKIDGRLVTCKTEKDGELWKLTITREK